MRILLIIIALTVLNSANLMGQKIVKKIKAEVTEKSVESQLRFLASDELRGRDTGSPELDIAARYIAEKYRGYGLKIPEGLNDYFQPVQLQKRSTAKEASFTLGDKAAVNKEDIMFLSGQDGRLDAEVVFLNYGLEADYEGKDVNGKIVMALPGSEELTSPREYRRLTSQKLAWAEEHGALGLVELYKSTQVPWKLIVNFMSQDQMDLATGEESDSGIFLAWLSDGNGQWEKQAKTTNAPAKVMIRGAFNGMILSQNVIGWIEGKHPEKKKEYLVMTAHYDHVGVNFTEAGQDSIFNGTRDNAIGVVTLLETAKILSENQPDYSVVFIALTAEEKGLLGSEWYAKNPIFPLNKTFFNFNTDGGGYDDTSIATVIGLNRTGVTNNLKKAVAAFGLGVTDDPVPEQNLFDRSDNVSFARKGVPAITFSCGIRSFGEEILKYYHQAADEVDTLDIPYLTKYTRSFVYAAYLIANSKDKPFWNSGDKYEEAGKTLYGL